MAASIYRVLTNIIFSKKNQLSYSQFSAIINRSRYLSTQTSRNNKNEEETKFMENRSLTYALTLTSALGIGYTLYKWKNEIYKRFNNNLGLKFPTVYAKSVFKKDISQNRDKYNFIADVVEVSAPSVVYIVIEDGSSKDSVTGKASASIRGAGFIVSEDGLILTNAHVVINRPKISLKVRLHDGSDYIGQVEDIDQHSDLATVRIDKKNLPVMKLGRSSDIRPGEFVVAIGSPLTLSKTITSGVVSSANRPSGELGWHHKHMEYIQTDAPITFGNSGGPLVNLCGEAIGINAMKVTTGISFAIPIDYAKEFLKKAESRRNSQGIAGNKNPSDRGKRRYLGITMLTLSTSILNELQLKESNIPLSVRHGVLIWKVIIGSPAFTGGLKAGDIITHVNDEHVIEVSNIFNALEKPVSLVMTVVRNGETLKLRVEPEDV